MARAVYTVPGLQAQLRKLPKDLSKELRLGALDISTDVARGAEGRRTTPQQRVVPVKPRKDRIPKIVMGGRGRTRHGGLVSDVMWGANFGSHRFAQFPPVRKPDWFLYATVEDMENEILDRYGNALSAALRKI